MTTTLDLPFQLGQPQQAGGITMTPLFPLHDPVCDYVSLDEALAGGLQISEVGRGRRRAASSRCETRSTVACCSTTARSWSAQSRTGS